MRQARLRGRILYRGIEIKLYHDFPQITLQKHKALCPLLDTLKESNIPKKGKMPFSLQVGSGGSTTHLRYPEEAYSFCEILGIPADEISDWHCDT